MKHRDQIRAWVLGLSGAFALSAIQAHQTQPEIAPEAASAAEAQALRAVRDKATGKLRAPTADEEKAMAAAERAARKARGEPEVAASQPLVVTRHASGMRSAVLGAEYLVTVQARRHPDGSLAVTHDDPAHEHAKAPAKPTAAPTE